MTKIVNSGLSGYFLLAMLTPFDIGVSDLMHHPLAITNKIGKRQLMAKCRNAVLNTNL
jgi:hypothetical protein